jgi:hypothetical protein
MQRRGRKLKLALGALAVERPLGAEVEPPLGGGRPVRYMHVEERGALSGDHAAAIQRRNFFGLIRIESSSIVTPCLSSASSTR